MCDAAPCSASNPLMESGTPELSAASQTPARSSPGVRAIEDNGERVLRHASDIDEQCAERLPAGFEAHLLSTLELRSASDHVVAVDKPAHGGFILSPL